MKNNKILLLLALGAQVLNGALVPSESTATMKVYEEGTQQLVIYTDVPGLASSEFYNIRVRSAASNGNWVTCYPNITRSLYSTIPADAQGTNNSREHYYAYVKDWSHTYANIEMSPNSRVEVEVSRKNGVPITRAAVHPAVRAEPARVVDGKALLYITNPAQITIDIDGQMDETNTGDGYAGPAIHTVSLFANPVIAKPSLKDPTVMVVEPGVPPASDLGKKTTLYFKPGVHDIGRNFKISANKNYYIPGDAIVYGTLNNLHGDKSGANIKIYGYGTLSGDRIKHPKYEPDRERDDGSWKLIYAMNASNFRVEGISLMNCPKHTSNINSIKTTKKNQKETFFDWVKVVTWRINGDGIGTAHEIKNSFIRTQDDCTYVKGDRIKCVFWTDVNGAVFTMAGMPPASERDMLVEDCDIIYARHCTTSWAGGRVFSKRDIQAPKDPGLTQINLLFKDIRITDKFQTLETFQLVSEGRAGKSGGFSGITFKNVTSVKTPATGDNVIIGWSDGQWNNITFDNVNLGTKRITAISDFGKITTAFTAHLTFISR